MGGRDPSCNMLIVKDCIYENPSNFNIRDVAHDKNTDWSRDPGIILTLTYDSSVNTVCTESVELAEQLAADAITEH